MNECDLCKIALGPSCKWKVYEDEYVLAVLEGYPIHKGHTIVFPKKHYDTLMDMPLDEVAELFKSVASIAKAVKHMMGVEGVTIIQSNGQCAWQNLPHVYVSVIPRFQGDKVKIAYPSSRISDEMQEEVMQSLVKEICKNTVHGVPESISV